MTRKIIRLPYLHAGKFGADKCLAVSNVWPGVAGEESENSFMPAYPLQPHEAAQELERMRQLDLRDLETMRHASDRQVYAEDSAFRDEMGSLAAFMGAMDQTSADNAALTRLTLRAQRMLLWCWLAEERALEVCEIEKNCNNTDQKLLSALGDAGLEVDGENWPDVDLTLLAPWKICLASAAFFMPGECAIFAEGKMGVDIAEYLDFSHWEDTPGLQADLLRSFPMDVVKGIFAARAPLWLVLGHTGSASGFEGVSGKVLKEIYGREFLWLIRKSL